MITAGSVRGKTSVPVVGSRCTQPARSIVVGGAGQRAEAVPLVPLEDRRSACDQQPGVEVAEVGADLAQPGPGVDRPAAHGQRPLAADRRVRDAVGLAEVDRAGGQLGLLVPHQLRPAAPRAPARCAAVDGEHPHRPAPGRVGQRRGRGAPRSWATRESTGTCR